MTMTSLENFFSVQGNMTALACCEYIKRNELYTQLKHLSTDTNIQVIQHLRLAQYIHFNDKYYDPELFEQHLNSTGKLLEKIDLDPQLKAQYWSEKSLYQSRKANQFQDDEKKKWIESALNAAKKAINLLKGSNLSIEELYRAHTYAAYQSMLTNDLDGTEQHFKKTSELEQQVNSTYKFGNYLYRSRYYSHVGDHKQKDQCIDECRQLLNTVTDLFDKEQLREMLSTI